MKNYLPFLLSIVAAMLFNTNSYAQPDTLSTAYGEGADVFISNDDRGGPEANYSDLPYLVVRKHEVRTRIIYLKFDITDIYRFEDGGTNDAYLGLNLKYSEKMADTILEVSVYGMINDEFDDWTDTTLSYSNAPGMYDADLNEYELDYGMVEYLTRIVVPNDTTGWIYSELSDEMDKFIDKSKNNLLTFILLVEVENENIGDEVRFFSEEQADSLAPILHAGEPTIINENSFNSSFKLEQNMPNPFRGSTRLSYSIDEPEHVELSIYNMLGAKVATLVNEFKVTGVYDVKVDMDQMQLNPGVYYAKITVGTESQAIKMINTD